MNIMLNQVCNLTCPYCFANEFVGRSEESLKKDKSQITMEDFKTAVDFSVRSGETRIGLIGGEPLLHPKFEELVSIATNSPVRSIHLFTNGVYLDNYFNLMGNGKFTILVNVNSPEDVGEKQYERMVKNLDYLYNKMYVGERVSLGVNIYKENMDFKFITKLIKKYGIRRLRVSVVVPNTEDKRSEKSLEYHRRMKPTVIKFFKQLKKLECVPRYDCNNMPPCILDVKEYDLVKSLGDIEGDHRRSGLLNCHNCNPVLDVLPNLEVVRCFGMSRVMKTTLDKFESTHQIRGFFQHELDSLMNIIPSNPECLTCISKNTMECSGGCLAFKINELEDLKGRVIEDYFKSKEVL